MCKLLVSFIIIGFLSLLIVSSVYARSGCCSHHGGVCGCGCCDGSSLSDTCAPYYPECSSGNNTNTAPAGSQSTGSTYNSTVPAYTAPTNTPIPPTFTPILPTNTPTPFPTATPTLRPTLTPIPTLASLVPTVSATALIPTPTVLGTQTQSNTGIALFVLLGAAGIIPGALWYGKKIMKKEPKQEE